MNETKIAHRSTEVYTPMRQILHLTEDRLRLVPVPKCLPTEDLPYFKAGGFAHATRAPSDGQVETPHGWKNHPEYFKECLAGGAGH